VRRFVDGGDGEYIVLDVSVRGGRDEVRELRAYDDPKASRVHENPGRRRPEPALLGTGG
jgi:hypothetical protein